VNELRSGDIGPTAIGVFKLMGGATVLVALTDGDITVGAFGGFAPNTVDC
jgi:hypothetical protein